MVFHIITLFPEIFESIFSKSIIARAIGAGTVKIHFLNPQDFASNRHKSVDDKPYGGGKGMVARVDIIVKALESVRPKPASTRSPRCEAGSLVGRGGPYTILLSASGKKYNQNYASKLAKLPNIALICGHYEGIDARVEKFVDEIISIGDFVLTGGEIAAVAIVDSVTRLIPGVIHPESLKTESFSPTTHYQLPTTNLLEYPQYTRPEIFRGLKVPPVLLSGNHKEVASWRQKEALKRTRKFRPDLLTKGKEKVQT